MAGVIYLLNRPRLMLGFNLASMAFTWAAYQVLVGPWTALGILAWLLIHEGGHLAAMARQGLHPALLLVPVGGALSLPRRPFRKEMDAVTTTLAGVAAGTVALVVGSLVLPFGSGAAARTAGLDLSRLLGLLHFLNLVNLTPIPMMDGSRVFRSLLASREGWLQGGLGPGLAVASAILILLLGGLSLITGALTLAFFHQASRGRGSGEPAPTPLSGWEAAGVCGLYLLCLTVSAHGLGHMQ